MEYLYAKSVHIIFVVSWMAGLFYIVRLFIYHVEANEKSELEREIIQRHLQAWQSKLWNIITTPAMVLAIIAGAYMIYLNPELMQADWMHVKLGFVAGLLVYHFTCQRIIGRLKRGLPTWTSFQLRLWNELATIFLVAIVFTVVLKSSIQWLYGLAGLLLFSITIMSAVKIYKYYRTR